MEPFEDENPFSTADPPLSSASSNSHVDVSSPSSPANHTITLPASPPRLTVQSPPLRSGFPSQGSGHSPRLPTPKSDFCCIRDQWLHSGEDVEIVVRAYLLLSSSYRGFCLLTCPPCVVLILDYGCAKDQREFNFAVHHLCHPRRRESVDNAPLG
jgi:hypothetical protein